MFGGRVPTRDLRRATVAAALLIGLGALVWATGLPFLFPSLGPSAYLLATRPEAPTSQPRRVVLGHAIGVLAGFAAFHLLAGGVAVTGSLAAGSVATLRVAAAGVVAVGLTTGGMLVTDTGHAPACATTLIVSLGILTTPTAAVLIVVAVVGLVAERWVMDRLLARWTVGPA